MVHRMSINERIDQIAERMNTAIKGGASIAIADDIAFEQLVQTARQADALEKMIAIIEDERSKK